MVDTLRDETIIRVPLDTYYYKRSNQTINSMKQGFSWYAFEACYGEDVYGPIVSTWSPRYPLKLLNISTIAARHKAGISDRDGGCDEQYDGDMFNLKLHKRLLPYLLKNNLHGTIIREEWADGACMGPEEVVIYNNPDKRSPLRRR